MLDQLKRLRATFASAFTNSNDDDLAASRQPNAPGTILVTIGIVGLVALALWVVWAVPTWQVNAYPDANQELTLSNRLELEDAFRKTLAQIVLSVFGLVVVYLTWRRTRASDATVRIMGEGHITDRFTKAIEQLGQTDGHGPNIEIRLGAIYALERIAIDSPRDHWIIMEILTAYVRHNVPANRSQPYIDGEKPRTDIQAILTVLGRRRRDAHREPAGRTRYIDLMRTRLCGARLVDAALDGADLEQTMLQGAVLWGAKLQGAALMEADLRGAILLQANLRNAFFRDARLEEADLDHADLSLAQELTTAQIQSARNWKTTNYLQPN
jgi:hypothetical protein